MKPESANEKFELMLPVGDKDMFFAAVENGADAVYYGVPHWNARGRTIDFSFDDVREMIRYAKIRGVRTFFAMNVLIFEDELDGLPDFIENLAALSPDAIIVQDVGLMRLFKAVAKDLEIHASTQMTIASAEGVEMAKRLGCTRAVLARELSLPDIRSIKSRSDLELEVFVHGALCISFSGQCLTSENIGGRSANRGQCAQSCRLPYKMEVDKKPFDAHGKNYPFSPRDLSAIDDIEELKDIGVKAFKVEGRLKSPEYVAAATIAFREKLDRGKVSPENSEPLEVLFSRGLGPGWLHGTNQQTLVNGYFSNHHGQFLGRVIGTSRDGILTEGAHSLSAGDGILFEIPGKDASAGSRLFHSEISGKGILLQFGNHFRTKEVPTGAFAYRNDSPSMEKRLKETFASRENALKIPLDMKLSAEFGKPLALEISDAEGRSVRSTSEKILERAKTPRENAPRIRKELSALTGTAYGARDISIEIPNDAFVIDKEIRRLRKDAVAAMDSARSRSVQIQTSAESGNRLIQHARTAYKLKEKERSGGSLPPVQITVLVRDPRQIERLGGTGIDRVILDLDWGVDSKKPLEQIRQMGLSAGIATIRVLKEGETKNLKRIMDLNPDFILVRNPGAFVYLQSAGIPLEGDYSLNVSNSLTAEYFHSQGMATLHPSLDLNALGTERLLENFSGEHFEISIFLHLPAFYMEHCLYAANLSTAERFPYCKQICSKHRIDVIDRKGARHRLIPDAECRNTLYLERPQSALNLFSKFRRLGVSKFRLEMLDESAAETLDKVRLYSQALQGKISIPTAARLIGTEERYGVAEGQLFHTEAWKDRKKF